MQGWMNKRRRSSTDVGTRRRSSTDGNTLTIDDLPKRGKLHPWSTYADTDYRKRPPYFSGPWPDALLHAKSDPSQIVDNSDSITVTLIDGYPKARHHYLIVPKTVELNSISEATHEHLPLLHHMHDKARKLTEKIMEEETGIQFYIGYHAVPSMKLLHLHVISDDFDSQRIRKLHHWNIFNTEYFIDSHKALEIIKEKGRIHVDEKKHNDMLLLPAKCNICDEEVDFNMLCEHRRGHDTRTYLNTIGLL